MAKVFLLPIETTSRELDYKIFISCLLAEKGSKVFIGSKSKISYFLNCFESFTYLDKGFHFGNSENFFNKLKQREAVILSLDEEGAIDFSDGSALNKRYSKGLFDEVNKVYFWGKAQFEKYGKRSKNMNQSLITGHPRFQILKPEYRDIFKNNSDLLKQKYGKFILVNTNTSFGNHIKGDKFVLDNYRNRFPKIDQIISQDKKKFEHICQTIESISTISDIRIILRPHPEEKADSYHDRLCHVNSLKIVKEGSVIPWISASSSVIHSDCTTAIESVMLGKDTISAIPLGLDTNLLCPLPIGVSYKSLNTKNAAEMAVSGLPVNYSSNADKILEDYFSHNLDSLHLLVDDMLSESSNSSIIKEKALFAKKIKLFLRNIFIDKSDILINEKTKGLNRKNFIKRFGIISKYLKVSAALRVKVESDSLFRISKFR